MEEITQIQKVVTIIIDFCVRYSFQIIGALIVLGLGIYIAGWLSRVVIRMCERKRMDVTLTLFIGRIVKLVVLTFVIIIALGKFGISVAPMIAALGRHGIWGQFCLAGAFVKLRRGAGDYHDTTLCGRGYDCYRKCERCC